MKENYQLKLDEIIAEVKELDYIPKLLLHSCCAPCSSYVIEYLSEHFEIIVYFYNPNIYPYEEFIKRSKEQERLINTFKTTNKVSFILGDYETSEFKKISKDLESEPEGGARCFSCYKFRMQKAAREAKKNSCNYFTSTLSISPYKNAEKLNKIGEAIAKKEEIPYLYADFKKKNGYKRSIALSKEFNLYRQDYCGCEYSYNELSKR